MRSSLARLAFAAVCLPTAVHAQSRFGIEVAAGQAGGATSYVRNTTYLQDDTLFLANELAGTGLALNLAFVFTDLELSFNAMLFDRSRVQLHHQAESDGPIPTDRIRPNGTIDDSGYTYRSITPTSVTLPDRSRGSLLLTTATGGWRYFILQGDVDVWVPISAGLAITHISEPTRPWVFGVVGSVGLGVTFDVAKPIAIFAQTRFSGVLTPTYGLQSDASRTSASVGESTLSASVSTLLYSTFTLGVQVTIR